MDQDAFDLQTERRLYFDGIAKFNEGDHFAAHDIWEEAWHRVLDRRREKFYRATIKSAVTLVLLRQGRAIGTRQVFVDCINEYEGLPQVFMGLNIPRHIDQLRHAIQPAIEDLAARHVPIDPARLFQIKPEYDPFEESKNGEGVDGRS